MTPEVHDMKPDSDKTTTHTGNVAVLLKNLPKESLAYKLVDVAARAQRHERQGAVAAVLQERVKALSKELVYAKDQVA